MSKPGFDLSARILRRLVEEKFLSESDAKKFVDKLAMGRLTAEDWLLALELEQERGAK